MRKPRLRRALHWLYCLVVGFKAIDALLETAGGVLFFVAGKNGLQRLVDRLTGSWLATDPDDRLAHALRHTFATASERSRVFAAVFLLGHGIVKSAFVFGLWRRWRWVFPAAVAALAGFALYELWRWLHTHSLAMPILAGVDLAAAALIWTEYRVHWPKKRR